ncbi:uncharacterized protein [Prorops nasuta]|uniref:uncharacterized protein n=1 Tax=Prorops nasuta TaxID=863751 RepID=UPI0034CDE2CE
MLWIESVSAGSSEEDFGEFASMKQRKSSREANIFLKCDRKLAFFHLDVQYICMYDKEKKEIDFPFEPLSVQPTMSLEKQRQVQSSGSGTSGDMDLLSLSITSMGLEVKKKKELEKNFSSERKDVFEKVPIISLDEVAWHDTADDCWLVIYDYVYDCTQFLKNHPGGQDVLLEYAGRDATLAFIGTGHSKAARKILQTYLIGELPTSERIFRAPGGVKDAFNSTRCRGFLTI